MQAEERDLIADLFNRLKGFETQPRDGEAANFIGALIAQQPGAPYLLTQTVLVQEQALKAAQARIAELEGKAQSGGFLSSAPKLGPWGAAPAAQAPAPAPPTRSPLQAAVAPQPAGGGFLRSALATAAGVAGGALLFEGIRGMFNHGSGPFGPSAGYQPSPMAPSMLGPDDSTPLGATDLAHEDLPDDDEDLASDDSSGFDGGSDDT